MALIIPVSTTNEVGPVNKHALMVFCFCNNALIVICSSLGGRRRNRDRRRGFGEEDQGPVIDESTLSAKELQLLQEAEELLLQDQISRLKKVTVNA